MPIGLAQAAAAGKVLGPHLVRLAARERNRWYRRVAAEAAKDAPFPVPKKALRKMLRLPGTLELVGSGTEEGAAAAVALLRGYLGAHPDWRGLPAGEIDARCIEVLYTVQKVLLRFLDLGNAMQVLDQRASTRHSQITDGITGIEQRLDDNAAFDDHLTRLPPSLASIEGLRREVPRVSEFVRVFADEPDRGATLAAWVTSPPDWLSEGPALLWIYLAEALQSIQMVEPAIDGFRQAVSRGATPFGYAAAQAALLVGRCGRIQDANALLEPALAVENPHPLAAWVSADLREDHESALVALAAWTPTTERERDLVAAFTCRSHVLSGDEDAGIRALEAREALTLGSGVPLMLAQLLTSRAQRGRASTGREAELRRAADLAIRARDRARQWRGPSVEAVIAAANALILMHDWAAAWSILRPPPDGDAIEMEATSAPVMVKAAIVAAVTGRIALAHELAESADEPFEGAYLAAVIAEQEADEDTPAEAARLVALWTAAYDAAHDDEQRLTAARGLRAMNETVPDYDRLRAEYPEAVADIEQLAGVYALPADDRIARLRALRNTSPYAAVRLAEVLEHSGDLAASAVVLSEAADRFSDQQMRLMAARRLASAGDLAGAEAEVVTALAKTPGSWVGRPPALKLLLDLSGAQGRWADAVTHARQILESDAENAQARWALAAALANLGKHREAWEALGQAPNAMTPLIRDHAALHLDLTQRFGDRAAVMRDAVRLLREYGEDEQFCAFVLGTVYGHREPGDDDEDTDENDRRDSVSLREVKDSRSPELIELHRATADFFARFPDSRWFRQITFTTPEEARERIAEQLRPGAEERQELEQAVADGQMPSGMLSATSGRPYAEVFLRRASGAGLQVRSPDPVENDAERAALEAVIGGSVLIDASAIHSLSGFPTGLRDRLLGAHQQVHLTDDALRDLLAARDSTARRPTRFVDYDPDVQRAVVVSISAQDAGAVADRAQLMVDIGHRQTPLRWPAMQHLTELDDPDLRVWVGPLDAAKSTGQPLWCDDLALRRLALNEGVTAFGTTALLDLLRARGLSPDEHEDALVSLTADWCVDLDFDVDRLELVAAKADWNPGAAAFALSRPAAWRDVRSPLGLLRHAIEHCDGPDAVAGWMHAAATGLAAASVPEQAMANIERIAALGLSQPRVVGPYAAAVMEATRIAARRRHLGDPAEGALRLLHRGYLDGSNEETAARAVLAIAAGMSDADRLLAAKVIIEPR